MASCPQDDFTLNPMGPLGSVSPSIQWLPFQLCWGPGAIRHFSCKSLNLSRFWGSLNHGILAASELAARHYAQNGKTVGLQLSIDEVCSLMKSTVWWERLDKEKSSKGPGDAEMAFISPAPPRLPAMGSPPVRTKEPGGRHLGPWCLTYPWGKPSNITALLSPPYTPRN